MPEPVVLPAHLEDVLERMEAEMGVPRDALVAQAVFTLARLNGFVVPGEVRLRPSAKQRPAAPPRPSAPATVKEPTLSVGPPLAADGGVLFLVLEDGRLEEVTGDRFVIGRGKHCDLVLDTSAVSREHAALVREDGAWFIEDLGSANGTWFKRERIGRRRIEDGDEYQISSVKLRATLG